MALPICDRCASGRILCPLCESNLSKGNISVFDVEVSRVLREALGAEADFRRAIKTESQVVIVAPADQVGAIIGRGGSTLRSICERVGGEVRVMGADNLKEMASALIAPARIDGINEVLAPGGGKSHRIRIAGEDSGRLRMGLGDLETLIRAASGQDVQLAFD